MPHCSGHFLTERGFYRARLCHDFNKLYRPRTLMSLLDNKPLVKGVCPAGTNCVPQRRETLLAGFYFSSHFFVQAQKSREGWRRLILTGGRGRELFCHSKNNKRQVWRKLSPAAQKRGFACRRNFEKGLPQKSHSEFCGSAVFYSLSLIIGIRRMMSQLPQRGRQGGYRCFLASLLEGEQGRL